MNWDFKESSYWNFMIMIVMNFDGDDLIAEMNLDEFFMVVIKFFLQWQ